MRLGTGNVLLKTKALTELLLNMPKERAHLPQLKAVRKMKKVEKTKYPPGVINLQVLGNSLYLFTDQTRYLFNCAEGTQRLAHEHKNKLAKLDHVFVTSGRWDRVGGLPGVALTVQDIGVEKLWIHGPPGLDRLFSIARRFIIMKDLEVSTVNTLNAGVYEDHVLSVKYINVSDGSEEEIQTTQPEAEEEDNIDYYGHSRRKDKMIKVTTEGGSDTATVSQRHVAVQYAVHLKKKEGNLLIDKCIEMGVPPGPFLGMLKSGLDITLPGGKVVKAEDVKGGDCPGPIVLVIDCPTMAHLPNLVNHPMIKPYHTPDSDNSSFTHAVVHFTPVPILRSKEYVAFMEKFNASTIHLLINEETLGDANEAIHRMQTKLNMIDEEIFRLLPIKERIKEQDLKLPVNVVVGQTGLKVGLRGSLDVESPIWSIKPSEYRSELSDKDKFNEELRLFKEYQIKQPVEEKELSSSSPYLLFLGTGSSIPNKTRNVSSFFLSIDSENSMLFDCGEGSLGQLQRNPDFEEHLRKLKIIYISHLHADHHLGLFSFLKLKKGLIVIAPKQMSFWLNNYKRDFETDLDFTLIPCDTVQEVDFSPYGIQSISTCLVLHCPNAFGVSVILKNSGKKITYSGDTMPSDNLVKLGEGSDILIHEATMEDGLEAEAAMKMHSTVSQALQIGEKMNAKFTILTHFSQRYSKIPYFERDVAPNVAVAFDNMKIPLGRVGRVGGMMKVLEMGWKGDFEEMGDRKAKRERRGELKDTLKVGVA